MRTRSVPWAAAAVLGGVLSGGAAPCLADEPLSITVDAKRVLIRADDRPLLEYRYAEVPFKPYVRQWFSPAGVNILRDAPADHLHHHALMFAVGVDGVDFWGEDPAAGPGRQVHVEFAGPVLGVREGLSFARFAHAIHWIRPSDRAVLMTEDRTIEVYEAGGLEASLLTWESRFRAGPGKDKAELWGREYFGLGMRFLTSMDRKGRFLNADGKTEVAGTNASRSRWCAYTAEADGKTVTVAVFDCPGNPRHPATWFTMIEPFAYISATLDLKREPVTLTPDKPLRLRYGVALWDGRAETGQIDKLYHRWTAQAAGKPSSTAPAAVGGR